MLNQKIESYSPRRISRGFTLIEILVVLSIIILLASMLFVAFPGMKNPARRTLAIARINEIEMSLKRYHGTMQTFPTDTGFGLDKTAMTATPRNYDAGSLVLNLATDVIVDKFPSGAPRVPVKIMRFGTFDEREISLKTYNDPERGPNHYMVDPWGNPLGYIGSRERVIHNRDGGVDLFSCGPDGKTAWDKNGGCSDNYGYGRGDNFAYDGIGKDDAYELGDAALNGTFTKTNQTVLTHQEKLDDITNWDQ